MCTFSKFWFHFSSHRQPVSFSRTLAWKSEKKPFEPWRGKKANVLLCPHPQLPHKPARERGKKLISIINLFIFTQRKGKKERNVLKKKIERPMDGSGAYYASRTELLEWLNSVLPESAASQLQLKKVETCKTGIPYAILLAEIYPHLRSVISKRLKGASVGIVSMIATGNPHDANFGHQQQNVSEYDCQHNMKMIQDILNKNHISRLVEVDRIAKGHFPSNLEFLQWFRKFSADFGVQAQPALYTDVDVVAERGGVAGGSEPYPRSAQQQQNDNVSVHSSHLNATGANGVGGVGSRGGVGGDSTSRSIGATSTTSSANNTITNLSTASSGPKLAMNVIGGIGVGATRAGLAAVAERRPLRSTSGSRLAAVGGGGGGASPSSQSQSSVATRRLARDVSPRGTAAADRSFTRTSSAQSKESVNMMTTDRNLLGGGGPQRSSSAKRSVGGGGGVAISLVDKREERTGFRQAPPTPTPSSGAFPRTATRSAGGPAGVGSSPSAFTRSQYPTLSGSPQSIPSPSSKNNNRIPNSGGPENEYDSQEYPYGEERLPLENEAMSPATSPRSGRGGGAGNTSSRTSALTSADLKSFRARIAAATNGNGSGSGGGVGGGGAGGQTKGREGGHSVSLKNAVPIYGSNNNNNNTKSVKGGLVSGGSSHHSIEDGRVVGGDDESAVVGELNYLSLSAETQEHLLGQLNAKLSEAESDRDFFYDKLRMIETLINKQRTTRGGAGSSNTIDDDNESIVIENIRKILVSDNNEIAPQ